MAVTAENGQHGISIDLWATQNSTNIPSLLGLLLFFLFRNVQRLRRDDDDKLRAIFNQFVLCIYLPQCRRSGSRRLQKIVFRVIKWSKKRVCKVFARVPRCKKGGIIDLCATLHTSSHQRVCGLRACVFMWGAHPTRHGKIAIAESENMWVYGVLLSSWDWRFGGGTTWDGDGASFSLWRVEPPFSRLCARLDLFGHTVIQFQCVNVWMCECCICVVCACDVNVFIRCVWFCVWLQVRLRVSLHSCWSWLVFFAAAAAAASITFRNCFVYDKHNTTALHHHHFVMVCFLCVASNSNRL